MQKRFLDYAKRSSLSMPANWCRGLFLGLLMLGADRGTYAEEHSFPRLMGMNIGRPAFYDDAAYQKNISRHDVVILGFWDGWSKSKRGTSERAVVRRIKALNPKILIGQYTILNEWKEKDARYNMRPYVSSKLDTQGWWLTDANGRKVRWSSRYDAWDINISEWTTPDDRGVRYPQWLAKQDYDAYFARVPEFDIWYFDNALSRPAVSLADWNRDGVNDSRNDPRIAAAYRRGNVAYWDTAKKLAPRVLQIGNSDSINSAEYQGRLNGVFMEAVMGERWSTMNRQGWGAVMERYRSAMQHTIGPKLVGFNVHGSSNDFRMMRFGLTSCLLDNGYFSFTSKDGKYGAVAWFDEFEVDLGTPLDEPPGVPWREGVYKREFENGIALVNPTNKIQTLPLDKDFRRIKGIQDPSTNDGQIVNRISIPSGDGIVLLRAN